MSPHALLKDEASAYTSRHSERLAALREEAATIWQKHLDGEITVDEVAEKLNQLKRRHAGLFERILDL